MVRRHAHRGYTVLLPIIIASSSLLGGHAQLLGTLSRLQNLNNNDQDSIPPGQRSRSLEEEEEYAVDDYYRNDDKFEYYDSTLVDFVYTFGSPSTAKNPYISNPGNKCIPGIRVYTEDLMSSSGVGNNCDWWEQLWCTPTNNDSDKPVITNTDFAAQINIQEYPHPKMSTLILRYVDEANVDYVYKECNDDVHVNKYNFQSWPTSDQPAEILPGLNIHELDTHYTPRLLDVGVPTSIRSQLLDYLYVAMCGKKSESTIADCLTDNGISSEEWTMLAYMNHITDYGIIGTDEDVVFILKNDNRHNYRKCIISFAGAGRITGDLTDFLFSNSESTRFCGRQGIHAGVSDELWHITHNTQYIDIIKPALETCHEVTCVGYSLGGALCNLFTMCANNFNGANNDYQTLAWTKAVYSIDGDDDDDDYNYENDSNYAYNDDNINYATKYDDDYAKENDDSS